MPAVLNASVASATNGRRRFLRLLCVAFACMALLPVQRARAEAPVARVKAQYLLRFPAFVEWPAQAFPTATSPFVIAICGADDVHAEMQSLAPAYAVGGRPIELLALQHPEPASVPHLVFVGKDRSSQLPAWVAAYAERPVIVVGDAVGGLESGAALNFIEVGDRLRFEASPGAAQRKGLRLSSRLLGVAERVLGEQPS